MCVFGIWVFMCLCVSLDVYDYVRSYLYLRHGIGQCVCVRFFFYFKF